MTDTLPAFEGHAVRRAGIEIPNAAGGLREAMKIDPQVIRQGERRFVVLEVVCQKVRHEPIDAEQPGGDQSRVHVLSAQAATFVDEDLVRDHLDAQKARIALAADDDSGQQRIGHEQDLMVEHTAGRHKRLRKGCPACEQERDLVKQEKAAAKDAANAAKNEARKAELDDKIADIGRAKQ